MAKLTKKQKDLIKRTAFSEKNKRETGPKVLREKRIKEKSLIAQGVKIIVLLGPGLLRLWILRSSGKRGGRLGFFVASLLQKEVAQGKARGSDD